MKGNDNAVPVHIMKAHGGEEV